MQPCTSCIKRNSFASTPSLSATSCPPEPSIKDFCTVDELAHHGTQRLHLLHGGFYYRNKQPLNNLPSGIVNPHDLNRYVKQQPNFAPLEVKVTYKQQPNLPSGGVDLNDKQQPPSEEVNLQDKDQSTSEEVNLHDTQEPSREVDLHDKQHSPEQLSLHNKQRPKHVELHDKQQPPKHVELHDKQQPPKHVELHNKQQPPKQASLDNKQQPNPPSKEVTGKGDQQQQKSAVSSVVEINQHLRDLGKNVNFEVPKNLTDVKIYVASLSSSQVKATVAQMVEVNNLMSRISQEQFLACTGLTMLKSQPGSSISMPPSHQHCKTMAFKNSGPVVALASFPGSGNSWVRQLLEASTGIYTGAVYCDSSYIKAGMIGEGVRTNNVIAVKAHQDPLLASKLMENNKAIYIIRNPFDAILSEYNRAVAVANSKKYAALGDSHTLEIDANYETRLWRGRVMSEARRWKLHVLKWLTYSQFPVLLVGYENIKKDTHTELKKMLDFVEYPYAESDILCAVKSSGGAFHRKHTKKHGHPYSQELQNYVLHIIKEVDSRLLKHNISYHHPYNEN